ncbi:MAG: hypothetical protein GY777_04820 [Candidatus Brocadiaceae bacterium]|nr:hypothetical protein [Candidatus Brocadiaceae bacterium]
MSKYIFEVHSIERKNTKVRDIEPGESYLLKIEVYDPSEPIVFQIDLNIRKNHCMLEIINFNITNRTSSYCSGYFEMCNEEDQLLKAIKTLKKEANLNRYEPYTFYGLKWEELSRCFRLWYSNFLKPKLEQFEPIDREIFVVCLDDHLKIKIKKEDI